MSSWSQLSRDMSVCHRKKLLLKPKVVSNVAARAMSESIAKTLEDGQRRIKEAALQRMSVQTTKEKGSEEELDDEDDSPVQPRYVF